MSKKPQSDAGAKLQAAMDALAAAHDALAAAYGKLREPAVLASISELGVDPSISDIFAEMADGNASAAKDAAASLRSIELGRVARILTAQKLTAEKRDALKVIHTKVADAQRKKADAKTDEAERAAREPLEAAEAELDTSQARGDMYISAITVASLRELAHVSATFHSAGLEHSAAVVLEIPVPRMQ
ncbi:hypothetical protein T492DRAFT_989131 [Pavlovales sp. CCMP2436]|nr:hypothetical protein T492DRAFT_989131 [Pavlovales sp. CCMP2436]|mmetsp:Transcript_12684/g.32121  ORF Transcript_12684/g.32121 Transcript_12684/m.32121 type:complete len:187 (-) Transcript_12684:170-730(-)